MKKNTRDIKISKSKKGNTCTISLKGELTLNNVAAVRKEMIDALKKSDSLQLSVHHVISIDLSWIQLLHSLTKTCKESNKNIALEMTLSSEAELLFTRTGFSSLLESSRSTNQTIR